MLYISAISVMLLYHKLENDIQDGERLKRLAQRLIVRGYKKALSDYPVIGERISCAMETLYRLENEQCSDFATLEHAFSLPLRIYLLVYQTEMYLRHCGRSLLIM